MAIALAGGFGPHNIVSSGEIIATLGVLGFALIAMVWMARRTRNMHT